MNWLLVIGAAILGLYVGGEIAQSKQQSITSQFLGGAILSITFALIAAWIAWTVNP